MSNSYFQFKQFTIEQDRCAMKVTTDACIQGAWTPVFPAVKRVLDIGAGTGLLSLMLVQGNADIIIDAIEIDQQAAAQARDNIAGTIWSNRINVLEGDIRAYKPAHKYDLIITNPPFFNNSLLGPAVAKNTARHTLSLSYADLQAAIEANLNDGGYASILLPYAEYQQWKNRWHWQEIKHLAISHRPDAPINRIVALFAKEQPVKQPDESLIIKEHGQQYSRQFIELLAPFYLNL